MSVFAAQDLSGTRVVTTAYVNGAPVTQVRPLPQPPPPPNDRAQHNVQVQDEEGRKTSCSVFLGCIDMSLPLTL